MKSRQRLIIGTRGSQMALVQSKQVADKLTAQTPGLEVSLQVITTKGDTNDAPIPLDTVGKAWFTKEIEQALLDGHIDLAVHSLKDVPPEIPSGLTILPVLPRDDPRDALVSKAGKSLTLSKLLKGAVVGTDSLRRKTQLLRIRPDLIVRSVRGNANTRLEKLDSGRYDALVMAAAGLQRIGQENRITEFLKPDAFVPAIGQGTLAAEVRDDNPAVRHLLEALQDEATTSATEAERVFTEIIGGGCKLPVACYVRFAADVVHISGMVGSMDAAECIIKSISGPATEANPLAKQLAEELGKAPFAAQYVHVTSP
jgi:hydroxymethylbilane synthase